MNHTILLQRIERCIPNRVPVSLYLKDREGVYLWCNPYSAHAAGFSSNREVMGKTDNELPWHVKADTLRRIDQRVMTCGALEYLETWPIRHNRQGTFLTAKSPCYDEHGELSGVLGISMDISHQKQLKNVAENAEQVGASLFVGQGKHCPCNAEALFCAVKDMVNLAAGCMEISMLSQQSTLATPQYFSLQAMLNISMASIVPRMIGKSICYHSLLSTELPPLLCGQSLFIHRIIMNLLQNSLARIESGQVIIQANIVDKASNRSASGAVVRPAVSQNKQLRLKIIAVGKQRAPSFQSHDVQGNLRRQIVKKIVNLMGGTFELETLGKMRNSVTCLLPVAIDLS